MVRVSLRVILSVAVQFGISVVVSVFIAPRIACARLPPFLSRYCPPSPAIANPSADLATCPSFLPLTAYPPLGGIAEGYTDTYAADEGALLWMVGGSGA